MNHEEIPVDCSRKGNTSLCAFLSTCPPPRITIYFLYIWCDFKKPTMEKITEQSSKYQDLEKKSVLELLRIINQEDQTVPLAISQVLDRIEPLVTQTIQKMKEGGRLFYIGAGTSGRLGILDASECPPTFGVPRDMVIALIAGGDHAIRHAAEFAEDDEEQAWKDLSEYHISPLDTVIG